MYLHNFCNYIVKECEIFRHILKVCIFIILRISEISSHLTCVSSGFRREVYENCALPGYFPESSDNSLSTFQDILSVPNSRGTDRLSRTVCKELPLLSVIAQQSAVLTLDIVYIWLHIHAELCLQSEVHNTLGLTSTLSNTLIEWCFDTKI